MTDVLFYHLERVPLTHVLPGLLERTMERGWRSIVHVASEQRLDAIDSLLWTYKDNSFLPHGTNKDGQEASQPIYLTKEDNNPNDADVVFFIDGTTREDLSVYERAVYLFDGNSDEEVEQARNYFRKAKSNCYQVTYWRQDEQGKWLKRT